MKQIALDEIEGARQAGVIKTNLVPFARAIVMAVNQGTFTLGHGTRIISQREQKSHHKIIRAMPDLQIDQEIMNKGRRFMERNFHL